MSNNPRIRATAPTMRYIRDGMDIVGADIAEMVRRLSHPDGRKGYRQRALESELGLHGYPKETITIKIGSSTSGNTIVVLHEIGPMTVSVAVDGHTVLRVPGRALEDLPEAIRHGLPGRFARDLIDLTETSLAELGDAKIHSVFGPDNGMATIYLKAAVTEYDAAVFVAEYSPDRGQEHSSDEGGGKS